MNNEQSRGDWKDRTLARAGAREALRAKQRAAWRSRKARFAARARWHGIEAAKIAQRLEDNAENKGKL